jgi:hypothetical protein
VIVGLTGFSGSGKDTFAKSMALRGGFHRVAFADKLKELAAVQDLAYVSDTPEVSGNHRMRLLSREVALHGWDVAKQDSEVRQFLQELGTAHREVFGEDFWVRAAMPQIRALQLECKSIVITDVRYANEVAYVQSQGGFVIRIERPDVHAVNDHISDAGVVDLEVDETIMNDGSVASLGRKASQLIARLKGLGE